MAGPSSHDVRTSSRAYKAGANSEGEHGQYATSWGMPHGKVEAFQTGCSNLKRNRPLLVYLPTDEALRWCQAAEQAAQ